MHVRFALRKADDTMYSTKGPTESTNQNMIVLMGPIVLGWTNTYIY